METNSSMYGLVVWMMVSQDPGDHRILLATKISQVHANLDDFLTTKLGLIILHSTTYDVQCYMYSIMCPPILGSQVAARRDSALSQAASMPPTGHAALGSPLDAPAARLHSLVGCCHTTRESHH